jgi:hypothetical protein
MTKNRELAAAFGVLSVAWILLGHTSGYFIGLSASNVWIDSVATLLVLIFTPAVMSKARWTAPGAVIVGVIDIIKDLRGTITMPMSMAFGPAVALVLALLFTYFSFRAYQQK